MPAHLLEPPIVGVVAADEDRVHRGLHVIVDAPRAGPAEEGEGLVMGVEDHLLRLARIGPDEQHPAVAQADMRHLHGGRRAVDHHDLMAPVELVGLARIEAQRDIGGGRRLLLFLGPRGRVAPDSIIAAFISTCPESLENPDAGQPLTLGLAGVRRQHIVELVLPRINLRKWLDGPFVGELGHAGPDHLAHRVPRHPQLPADLLDRLPVLKIRPPDLRYRLHNQHPTLCLPMNSGAS